MRRLTNFIFLPLLTLALLNFGITEADVTYLAHRCPNTTTIFTANSTYKANLDHLLSSLTSNSTRPNGFYYSNAGGGSAETIYGLFLCRGDVSTDVCQECVSTASEEILRRCPKEKTTVIWYDECLLRYSNQSIFSTVDTNLVLKMWNTQNVSKESRLKYTQVILDTLSDVVSRAANDQTSGKKFAVKEVNYTASVKLYMLAQCTPDLTVSGCTSCLNACVDSLPTTSDSFLAVSQGVRVLYPSCNVRFETYRFYNFSAIAPPLAFSPSVIVPPPAPATKGNEGSSSRRIIAIVVPIVVIAVVICMLSIGFLRRKKHRKQAKEEEYVSNDITTAESLQFNLSTIQTATNYFSGENKVGEGGFGDVFEGTLSNGQQVAVKRLSRRSGQGAEEFKTEVVLVAKLQHRNLVRLLGFCLEGQEKILIYEFVPNKSLDYFLFDPKKKGQLDWSRRYKIIQGISRGILYLHEDSRLRIIHRDLKASNVLLDEDMNPKISDFGMARIFGVHQTKANTNRIVGTYGYMSPEYAMHGQFSIKSDVYSFGVLVLETISGKKNSSFYQSECSEDLLSYAWKHWSESRPLELMDPILKDSYSINEVMRCIHIGLLCVQEDPDDRPTMATTALMLNSFSFPAPLPRQPALFVRGRMMPVQNLELDQSTNRSMLSSVNGASITELEPR